VGGHESGPVTDVGLPNAVNHRLLLFHHLTISLHVSHRIGPDNSIQNIPEPVRLGTVSARITDAGGQACFIEENLICTCRD